MDKLEERLKFSKIAKFENDLLKTNEVIAPQSREILQKLVTSVNCRNFEELVYLRLLKTYHFQIWQI